MALCERSDRTAAAGAGDVVHLAAGDSRAVDVAPATHGLARIDGSVTRNGNAHPFASVQLARADGRPFATATADRLGRFHFDGLLPGALTLAVTHGKPGPLVGSRRLELRAGEDHAVVVALAYGSLAGRLVRVGDQQPRADVRVDVVASDGRVIATARSGPDGQFRLPIVQAGAWALAVAPAGEGAGRQLAVSIAANRATQLPDIAL